MHRLALILLLLTLALTPSWAASETPLIITMNGDIFTVSISDLSLNQLTTWGYNEAAVLSPDGTRVAYNSLARVTVDAILSQGGEILYNGQPPSNIWVMDVFSGDAVRLADQPENAAAVEYGFENALIRSTPTWSPDGDQLAWTELESNFSSESGLKLMVYDFASSTTTTLVTNMPMGFQDVGIYLPDVVWTDLGFVMQIGTVLPPGLPGGLGREILIFGSDGTLSQTIEVGSIGYPGSGVVEGSEILKENDGDVWDVISPLENTFQVLRQPPSVIGAQPEMSFLLQPFDSDTVYGAFDWKLNDTTVIPDARIDQVAFLPGGEMAAYISDEGVKLVSLFDLNTTLIPDTAGQKIEGITWSQAFVWSYGTILPPPEAQPETCAGRENPFSEGIQVQVASDLAEPVNVYALHNPLRYVIGRIEPGEMVAVNGMECDSENIYLQIDLNGVTGWIQTGIPGVGEAWVITLR